MDQVFLWAGRAALRNPSEQPCQPSKNPVHSSSFSGLLSLIKLKEVFCCGVSSLYSDCINIPWFFLHNVCKRRHVLSNMHIRCIMQYLWFCGSVPSGAVFLEKNHFFFKSFFVIFFGQYCPYFHFYHYCQTCHNCKYCRIGRQVLVMFQLPFTI